MSQSNIYPKDCAYGCNTRIYWNTAENTFFEVLTQKKHICPNSRKPNTISSNTTTTSTGNSYSNYSKKPWIPKQKMSNSFELLQGSITEVQKQYEVLSDIVIGNNGKVHGSQRDRDSRTGTLDLLVYYEVPEGKRDEVKQLFNMKKKPIPNTRVIT